MDTRLLKAAQLLREKRAGIGTDMLLAFAGDRAADMVAPGVGTLAGSLGTLHGLFAPTPTLDDIQKMDATQGNSALPGVGDSRALRRRRALRKLLKDKPGYFNLPLSEASGVATTSLAPVFAGALTGDETGLNAGAAIGLGGQALGSLAALFTKRRSLDDQAKVENSKSRALLRHIVPGLAAYDFWKGLGATRNLSGDVDKIRAEIKDLRARRKGAQTYPLSWE